MIVPAYFLHSDFKVPVIGLPRCNRHCQAAMPSKGMRLAGNEPAREQFRHLGQQLDTGVRNAVWRSLSCGQPLSLGSVHHRPRLPQRDVLSLATGTIVAGDRQLAEVAFSEQRIDHGHCCKWPDLGVFR